MVGPTREIRSDCFQVPVWKSFFVSIVLVSDFREGAGAADWRPPFLEAAPWPLLTITSKRIRPSNCFGGLIPRIGKIVDARSTLPLGNSSTSPWLKAGPAAI